MRTALVIAVAIGIASVIATIMVGTRTFEGTVVQDPYETGLRWDAERKARQDAGWTVSLRPETMDAGRAEVLVRVLDRNGRPLPDASVRIRLSRPHTARMDRTYRLQRAAPDLFRSMIEVPQAGIWDVTVVVAAEDRSVDYARRITVAGRSKPSGGGNR